MKKFILFLLFAMQPVFAADQQPEGLEDIQREPVYGESYPRCRETIFSG